MSKEYNLVMPFLDESESYCNGFELGQIWERMKNGDQINTQPVHVTNKKQLVLCCEYHGYEGHFTPMDADWILFSAQHIDITSLIN
jgi:hypothetical protein